MARRVPAESFALFCALSLAGCTQATDSLLPEDLSSEQALSLSSMSCKAAPPDSEIPLPLFPASQRVDLGEPAFSDPTSVDNPLFPISGLSQVIFVGQVDGEAMRTETTLLRGTVSIRTGSGVVRALTSQYIAYLDGRIEEVALDWYVQADDGAVWYLGEKVFNYEEGQVADRNGTWIACKDGPAAMIMPGAPRVGDVYRPENAYPIVFEEVQVKETGQVVAGPRGRVAGAITVEELHMDGTREDKIFAPGYGEFRTGSGSNFEALALAVPTDALAGGTPPDLMAVSGGAEAVFSAARREKWMEARVLLTNIETAWSRHRLTAVPPLLGPVAQTAMDDLAAAVAAEDQEEALLAAVALIRVALDLRLQFERPEVVDDERIDMWLRQLLVDAVAEDRAGVDGDLAALGWVLQRQYGPESRRLEGDLVHVRTASRRGRLVRVALLAAQLLDAREEEDED